MTKKFDVAFKLLNEYELVASSQHETKKWRKNNRLWPKEVSNKFVFAT